MRLIDADALEKRFEYLENVGNDLAHKVTEEEKGRRMAYHLAKYETHVAPTIVDTGNLRPQWIPVAERLPEKYEDVLITYRIPNEKAARIWFGYRVETGWCAYGVDRPNPTAWMPLPEPYEPEDLKQEV